MQILIVDDDPDDLEFFTEAIHDIDASIVYEIANNGEEALRKLQSCVKLPNFVFLDVNMPIMDGKTCLKEIRKHEKFKSIHVVIYSTTMDKEEVKVLRLLGADYIGKPTSYDTLKKNISSYIYSHI